MVALLSFAAGLAVVAAILVTVGGLVNRFVLDEAIPDFDASYEGSLNNWMTVTAAGLAALVAAIHAFFVPARRLWFGLLAVFFAFLSFDDAAQVHERIASRAERGQWELDPIPGPIIEHIEMAVFAPLLAATLLIAWAISREVSAREGRFLRVGLVLLVIAVIIDLGAELTTGIEPEDESWPHRTRIAFEEGFEVAGWILVAGTLAVVLCRALLEAGAAGAGKALTTPNAGATSEPRRGGASE